MRNAPNRNHVASASVLASHGRRGRNHNVARTKTAMATAHHEGGRQARMPVQRRSERVNASQNIGWRGGFWLCIIIGSICDGRVAAERKNSEVAPKREGHDFQSCHPAEERSLAVRSRASVSKATSAAEAAAVLRCLRHDWKSCPSLFASLPSDEKAGGSRAHRALVSAGSQPSTRSPRKIGRP